MWWATTTLYIWMNLCILKQRFLTHAVKLWQKSTFYIFILGKKTQNIDLTSIIYRSPLSIKAETVSPQVWINVCIVFNFLAAFHKSWTLCDVLKTTLTLDHYILMRSTSGPSTHLLPHLKTFPQGFSFPEIFRSTTLMLGHGGLDLLTGIEHVHIYRWMDGHRVPPAEVQKIASCVLTPPAPPIYLPIRYNAQIDHNRT